jgi:sugar lactone lactonase YvrE
MTPTPEVLLDGLVFPEGPRWRDGKLWFSEMSVRQVMTVDPAGRSEVVVHVPERPSGLGFLADGALLIVSTLDCRLVRFDSAGLRTVADLSVIGVVNPNDMVVDGQGRAYIGDIGFDDTASPFAPKPGNIALVTPDGDVRVAAHDLRFPNGMAITPDGKTLIVAETMGAGLIAFDIAPDGSLSGRRTFAELPGTTPDGVCLDADGAVWLGSPLSSEFIRVKDGGDVTHRVPVPGKWAVACMLGSEDRRTLFLCTAQTTLQDLAQGKSTGWIEVVRVEVPGAGYP